MDTNPSSILSIQKLQLDGTDFSSIFNIVALKSWNLYTTWLYINVKITNFYKKEINNKQKSRNVESKSRIINNKKTRINKKIDFFINFIQDYLQ
jgi:hypothetical protein